ncbi:MAG TPA: MauE/DoxX family redox-associated membrane protein [Bacteroidota bacterium]
MIKSVLSNEYVLFAFRLLVGLTFVFASIDKIADPLSFANAVANYRLVAGSVPLIVATVLPWVELLCGFAVLSGLYYRGGVLILLMLLIAFTLAVITGLIRGLDISCGCFTLDPDVGRIGWNKVFENIGLILAGLVLFPSRPRRFVLTPG